MRLVAHLDELGGNPDALVAEPYASLQDVTHVQLASDLIHALVRVLVSHGRGARDHAQARGLQLAQLGDRFFGEPVREVILLGIVTQVLEREHDDHDLALGRARGGDESTEPVAARREKQGRGEGNHRARPPRVGLHS